MCFFGNSYKGSKHWQALSFRLLQRLAPGGLIFSSRPDGPTRDRESARSIQITRLRCRGNLRRVGALLPPPTRRSRMSLKVCRHSPEALVRAQRASPAFVSIRVVRTRPRCQPGGGGPRRRRRQQKLTASAVEVYQLIQLQLLTTSAQQKRAEGRSWQSRKLFTASNRPNWKDGKSEHPSPL